MTTNPAPNVITTAVALIAASVAAVVALLIWHPELFLWIIAVCALCALLGVGIVACDFRAERNEAVAESERLERELEARAPGVTMVPHVTFTAPTPRPLAGLFVHRADVPASHMPPDPRPLCGVHEYASHEGPCKPDLHIVPPQRRQTDDEFFAALYDENGEHRA